MASEFKNVSIALDNNLLVADSFDGVTLKWNGGAFFSYRNTFSNCVLELTMNAQESLHPELRACRLQRKSFVDLAPDTIGLPMQSLAGPGYLAIPWGIQP